MVPLPHAGSRRRLVLSPARSSISSASSGGVTARPVRDPPSKAREHRYSKTRAGSSPAAASATAWSMAVSRAPRSKGLRRPRPCSASSIIRGSPAGAGLVGDLAGATAAELLGTVAEHYTTSSAPEEIAIWRAAHGGSLDPLVQAVRDCPFLSRRVALLMTLARSVPEGTELLAELIRDPDLGPVVLLAEKDDLSPQDASPDEAAWIMTGSLLELLEIGGPEAVREQLKGLPPAQRKDTVRAGPGSGSPAPETLEEFRTLVAEPILHAPARPHAVQDTRRPRPRKPHRR